MDFNNTNLLNFVVTMSAGTMIYDVFEQIDTGEKEIIFIIKEDNVHINRIGKHPNIELLSGLFNINDIALITLMVQFKDNMDTLYESYLNIFSTNLKESLYLLSKQNTIKYMIFGEDNKIKKTIIINNNIKKNMAQINMFISEYIPWTMEEFDKAKELFMGIYPDGFVVWDELQKGIIE